MKVSLNWLKDFVNLSATPEEIAQTLTMIGFEVEGIEYISLTFTGVVVGDVLEKEKHPNADKLSVCKVDVGNEVLNIVCGAPNVAKGQRVPVATIGAVLKDDFTIKPVKLRGVDSHGMICSERELGLSDSHSGILVLDTEQYQMGEPYKPVGFDEDVVFEVNVTPNRPDCLSHLGIARELACAYHLPLTLPKTEIEETELDISDYATIEIEDSEACPRYVARLIRDVKLEPSPVWMKNRLEAVGIRSINNVVDITNYVLMETGQPLHAFDYDLVAQKKIVVRPAQEGENFITLDDQTRKLKSSDLLICDGEKGVALAGVMGGQNSEVKATTQHILLESAYFSPLSVRKTAKRLGMSTEASQRFERGADPENTVFSANRAAHLFMKHASGKIAKGFIDVNPKKMTKWTVPLRHSRISKILGAVIEKEQVIRILNGLQLITNVENDLIQVEIPTYRPDLTREIDLIEEIVRHHGYDVIEPNRKSVISLDYEENKTDAFVENLKDIVTGIGFMETLSDGMVSQKHVTIVTPKVHPVQIKNPLSPDTAFMRTSILPGLLDAIRWNKNRSTANLRFFEIGKVFWLNAEGNPSEILEFSAAITGESRPIAYWGESVEPSNFYQLKGFAETLFGKLNINDVQFASLEDPKYEKDSGISFNIDNEPIGQMGILNQDVLEKADLEKPVYVMQFSVQLLMNAVNSDAKFRPIAKFPAVKRDLAILADKTLKIEDLQQTIAKKGGALLNKVQLFDLYQGDRIPESKKSIAFSLEFISEDRTLTEKEIEPIMLSIIRELEATYQCTLRS